MNTWLLLCLIEVFTVTLEYELRCPLAGEWPLRARIFYCGRDYVCLFHSLEKTYHESCEGLDYSSTGSKLIFEPFFNKAQCSYNRYQPFPFSTDGSSECVYQKYLCNEEGQLVFLKGSFENDTTCECDYSKGYAFVTKPRHNCYCIPSEEDCSCHKHTCHTKDIECLQNNAAFINTSCSELITRPLPENDTPIKPHEDRVNKAIDIMDFGKKGRSYRDQCLYFTMALLLIIIVIKPLFEYIDYWFDRIHKCEDPSKDNSPVIVVIAQTDYGEQINGTEEAKKALQTTSKPAKNLNTVSEIGIIRKNNQSESTTHPIIQFEAVHLDNLALPEYQSDNLRLQQTLISAQSISDDSPQPPVITSDTSLPLAVNTVSDLNIENNNQYVCYENNHCLSTSFTNLGGTATGQSENVQTVPESVVSNKITESLSEYDNMQSCSDNLLVSMEDQSNTKNDIDTPVVLPVINSRSYLNPEFQLVARMQSVPQTDAEPCTVASITEKMNTILNLDDEKDITDAVILYAEDDRHLVLEFIKNMETEFPELKLNFKLFEELNIGKRILESAPFLFRTCRFVCVFVTKIFEQDVVSKYVSEMLLLDSITFVEKYSRLIPILKDDYYIPMLNPLIPLKYNRYLEGKSQNKKDNLFLKTFERFVLNGRKSYLIS